MDERVKLAARNNALWCDSVCRAHGLVTELTERLWICHDDPPRYHSNAVTLSPGAGDAIEVLKPNGFKDGFYEIDARSLGYTCLFEASWIWLESTARGDSLHAWKRVETDDELLQWEQGWAEGDADAANHPRQFPPELLRDGNNAFMGCYEGGKIVAGCIFNLTPPVVGVSNTFAIGISRADMWHDIRVFGAGFQCPVVGYERGEDLELVVRAGFEKLAPLRVWVS